MGFNANPPAAAVKQITAAIEYLRQGRHAEAFLLLSEPGAEAEGAARFALGLCHLRAAELEAALSCFEQALNLFRVMPSKPPPRTETSGTYLKLAVKQVTDKTYLSPMDPDFCTSFPKAAEQAALLALVDSYRQNGMMDKARRLSAGLTGPVFENFKKELLEN